MNKSRLAARPSLQEETSNQNVWKSEDFMNSYIWTEAAAAGLYVYVCPFTDHHVIRGTWRPSFFTSTYETLMWQHTAAFRHIYDGSTCRWQQLRFVAYFHLASYFQQVSDGWIRRDEFHLRLVGVKLKYLKIKFHSAVIVLLLQEDLQLQTSTNWILITANMKY